MYIDNEVKLDFKDVLIRPKRSNLTSRSEVDLEREFTFKHSSVKWKGVPIMISNMDTTGTFEMAIEASKFNIKISSFLALLFLNSSTTDRPSSSELFIFLVTPNIFRYS